MNDNFDEENTRIEIVPWHRWLGQRILSLCVVAMTIVAATTVIGFFARLHWVADLFTNLRMQQIIGLAVLAGIFGLARHWRYLAVTAVLLAIHLPWFIPAFTSGPNQPEEKPGEPDIVVMTVNVFTSNREHEAIETQIKNSKADVVAVLELGSPLHARLESSLSATYPHTVTIPQDDGNFGIGLYSRFPLSDVDEFALNVDRIHTIAATVAMPSGDYRVIATHPLPPVGRRGFQCRNDHLNLLSERITGYRASHAGTPLIVAGDLNLTPWSPMFADFESASGLTRSGRGHGVTPTWYAMQAFPFGLILDHVFTSRDLRCVSRSIGADVGSDHRAVIVGLAKNQSRKPAVD